MNKKDLKKLGISKLKVSKNLAGPLADVFKKVLSDNDLSVRQIGPNAHMIEKKFGPKVGDKVKVNLSTGTKTITEEFFIDREYHYLPVSAAGRKFRGMADSGLKLEFYESQIIQ